MADERVQRKLAAILAADVVGYSRLMREDEAGKLAQLKVLHKELLDPKFAEYGGRIFETTGDGFLIDPLAHLSVNQRRFHNGQKQIQRGICLQRDANQE